MNRLVSNNIWKQLSKIASRGRRLAAIAYVTSDKHLKFKRGDTLVTDASDSAIRAGVTSAKVLAAAHRRGASIFSCEGLHAKILVCARIASVGSANLSTASAEHLIEAVVVTDDPTIVAQSSAFVDQITRQAIPVDKRFLGRILAIKVKRYGGQRGKRSTATVRDGGGRIWLVGVRELAEDAHADEAERAEAGEKITVEVTQ
jgi:phosphatidylserine/phosphatidylglycerophosphate/cardiolipin synthase-like enzyme